VTKLEFVDFVEQLAELYGKTGAITEKRIELMYRLCCQVPGEPLEWILKKIAAEHQYLPGNLPKAVNELWQAWKAAHPHRVLRSEAVKCRAPGCERGYIHLIYPDGVTRGVAFCAACAVKRKLCHPESKALKTLDECRAAGYCQAFQYPGQWSC
jgi:hypothetical protein